MSVDTPLCHRGFHVGFRALLQVVVNPISILQTSIAAGLAKGHDLPVKSAFKQKVNFEPWTTAKR